MQYECTYIHPPFVEIHPFCKLFANMLGYQVISKRSVLFCLKYFHIYKSNAVLFEVCIHIIYIIVSMTLYEVKKINNIPNIY